MCEVCKPLTFNRSPLCIADVVKIRKDGRHAIIFSAAPIMGRADLIYHVVYSNGTYDALRGHELVRIGNALGHDSRGRLNAADAMSAA